METALYSLPENQPWRKDSSFDNTKYSFRQMLLANGVGILSEYTLAFVHFVKVNSAHIPIVNKVIKIGAFNASLQGTTTETAAGNQTVTTVKPVNGPTSVTVTTKPTVPIPAPKPQVVTTKPTVPTSTVITVNNPKEPQEQNASLPILAGLVLLAVVMSKDKKKKRRR